MDTAAALIPDELRQQIPGLRSQEGSADPIVYAVLHRPREYQAWLITELEEDIAFGWVIDHDDGEFSEFSLTALVAELPEIIQFWSDADHRAISDGPHNHRVRRDLAFTPRPLRDARNYYDALWEQAQSN
jgi:hypothetical protein